MLLVIEVSTFHKNEEEAITRGISIKVKIYIKVVKVIDKDIDSELVSWRLLHFLFDFKTN